MFGVLL